jgi:hypothetical protein
MMAFELQTLWNNLENMTNKNFNFNTFSIWGDIKHNVPYGSTLGPVIFLLYVNDLSTSINGQFLPHLFADDSNLLLTNSVLEDFVYNIKNELESLNKWFKAKKTLNEF